MTTPLGGISENEWKLRALEEEVMRIEAQLEEERGERKRLQQQQLLDVGPREAGQDGSVKQGEGVNTGILSIDTECESMSSVVTNAAALSAGLPVSLRIQALAQTLALLEEELERERMMRQQVLMHREQGGGMPNVVAQQVPSSAEGGSLVVGGGYNGQRSVDESARQGASLPPASSSLPHTVESRLGSVAAAQPGRSTESGGSQLNGIAGSLAPHVHAHGPAQVISLLQRRGGVLQDQQLAFGGQDHMNQKPLEAVLPCTHIVAPSEAAKGDVNGPLVADHVVTASHVHEGISTRTALGAALLHDQGAMQPQRGKTQRGSEAIDLNKRVLHNAAAIAPESFRGRTARLSFWGWLTGADVSSQSFWG
jgi:hypothetical protein